MSQFIAFHAEPFEEKFLSLRPEVSEEVWKDLAERSFYQVDSPEALLSEKYAPLFNGKRRLLTPTAGEVVWNAALAVCKADDWADKTSGTFFSDLLNDPLIEDLRDILGGPQAPSFAALAALWTSAGFLERSKRAQQISSLPWWLSLKFGSACVGFSDPQRVRDIVKSLKDTEVVGQVLGLLRQKPRKTYEEALAGEIEGLAAFWGRAAAPGHYVVGFEYGT